MKQRFSSIDVKVIAHELSNSLVTLRLANVYDLSSKIFLLKFAKPDDKKQMILDAGFRCHLTSFARATAAAPSAFVAKLRKYLKTRRVTAVSQVGTDRIIEFQFSDGQYRLFLEFYAAGNVIVTDKELNILSLLRIVPAGEGQEELRVGLKYSLENRQNYGGVPPLTKLRLQETLQKAVDKEDGNALAGKKQKKKASDALRKALAVGITEYPPLLVEHAMKVTSFDATVKPSDVLENNDLLDHLLRTLQEAQKVVQEITSSETTKGYIIAKKGEDNSTSVDGEDGSDSKPQQKLLYDDFHPFRPSQFEDNPSYTILTFDGFNQTVDEFFSSIEGQKLESRLQERELNAKRKMEAARQDQARRLGGLQEIQTLNVRKAEAIEANVLRVQEAMDAVNGLIAQGMDWVEIAKLVELEQKRNNPVASLIKLPLKLHENTITLLLDEEEEVPEDENSAYETDSEASSDEVESVNEEEPKKSSDKTLSIDINLGLSPWSNAREYYDQKRSAADKEQRTLQSTTKALKSTEQKITQELKKGLKQEKPILRPVRKQMWFEKFVWFISSDGYLVLGGRDASQNEILYKRYLRKGDVYVHADLHGAPSIVIRNSPLTPDAPIPPSTLSQAGTLAVAASNAWDSKAGMSAWWVNADQVSKSAPTGEYLPTGSFMVRGKKNFLPPAQLLLGFGVLFHISDESKAKHVKHRLQDDRAVSVPEDRGVSVEGDEGTTQNSVLDEDGVDEDVQHEEDADHDDDEDANEEDEGNEDENDDEPSNETRANPLLSSDQHTAEEEEEQLDEDTAVDATRAQLEDTELQDEPETPPQDADQPNGSNPVKEEAEEDAEREEEESAQESSMAAKSDQPTSKKGPAPLPRGKRAKVKRIAAKYKDQDEEDRQAAQALIGSTLGREKAAAEAAAKAKREAEQTFQRERRRAQHQKNLKATAEHEEVRKMMLDEGVEMLDDSEAQKMTNLDAFVGTPLAGDEIIDAIPICAPWNAMGKYKYKVKLQPGPLKKGKAVKEIVGRWVAAGDAPAKAKVIDPESRDPERIWPREMELIRGWKVEECINVVPVGKVRVMMSGGAGGGSSGNKGGQQQGKGKGAGRGKGKR